MRMEVERGGRIVIVKRDGTDGSSYPLVSGSLSVGSGKECDIRIKTESVAKKHCVIELDKSGQAAIRSFSARAPVVVNNRRVFDKLLNQGDIISIDGAKFRWDRGADSAAKRKKTDVVEKLENPTVLDKNKRAAFVLMTARSPGNRDNSRNTSNVNFKNISPRKKVYKLDANTPKTLISISKSHSVCAKTSAIRESRLKMAHSETKNGPAPSGQISSLIGTRRSKIPKKITETLASSRIEKSKRKSTSKVKPLLSNSNYTENSPLNGSGKSTKSRSKVIKSKDSFDISGVEAIADSECRTPPESRLRASTGSVLKEINVQSTKKIKSPAIEDHISPTPIKTQKRSSQRSKNNSSLPHNPDSNPITDRSKSNEIMLVSFISSLANALEVVNNPDAPIDVEAVLKTPEFCALNNRIKSAGKTVDFAIIDSPSPQILEIGNNENKNRRGRSFNNESRKYISSSPIISPKQGISSNISDVSLDENTDNIISTPNLSAVFAVDSSTPLETRKSVQNRIEHFESIEKANQKITPLKKSSRLSNPIGKKILERKIQFERRNSEPKSRIQKASRIKDRKSLTVTALKSLNSNKLNTRSNKSISPEANLPNNDEIVITPKSTIKPIPEILKEKHSTAKKPVSKKSIIDHLTRSPEVVKELFKSPVKRKLSRSMNHYNSSKIFDDSEDICVFNITGEGVPELSNSVAVVSAKKNKSIQKSPVRSLRNSKVRRLLITPKPKNFPKNESQDVQGVRKLLATPKIINSPKNDLRDVRGVKKLLATPKPNKSPKNDLRDVRGVKKLLATPKPVKSPKNDLRDVRGVKKLLATPKPVKSPKNDLRDVRGVKKLLASPKSKKSPKNDLRDIRGVKKLLATPKTNKSPENDLRDVRGVKRLLATPKPNVSPKNDLTDVRGVKRLLATPKAVSPKNDLRDVRGVKKLLATPKKLKSPQNDLQNVRGLRKLLATPKKPNSPKNNLEDVLGVELLFKSPINHKSPKNDLGDVRGVKRLLQTPKIRMSKRLTGNNSGHVEGVLQLFTTPTSKKSPNKDLSNVNVNNDNNKDSKSPEKHQSRSFENKSAILFDSLIGKTPQKTYSNTNKRTSNNNQNISGTENRQILSIKTESDIIQDMKSAFMKYEANVSSEFPSPNKSLVKNTTISQQPQSTPVVEIKAIKVTRNNRQKSDVQLPPRVTRSKVIKNKSPVKNKIQTKELKPKLPKRSRKEDDELKEIEPPKKLRSQKSALRQTKDETNSSNKTGSISKKKVSFSTKVKLMGDEKSTVIRMKSTKSTSVSEKNSTKELRSGRNAKNNTETKTAVKNTGKKVSAPSNKTTKTRQKSLNNNSSTTLSESKPIVKNTAKKVSNTSNKTTSTRQKSLRNNSSTALLEPKEKTVKPKKTKRKLEEDIDAANSQPRRSKRKC